MTEHLDSPYPDINEERLEQLKALFPEAFTEGKLDIEKLRQTLGEDITNDKERFNFTWAGKSEAIQEIRKPAWGTLVPAKDESIDFENTKNIFIEGENLEALKLLYKAYHGRVKLIYIDPPYNTGKDFVYNDKWGDSKDYYLRLTGQKDSDGNLLSTNTEANGRLHSNWLNMMYPRLFLARQLLREDGVIFVSIDDNEVHNLRALMNEVFGEKNFVGTLSILTNPRGRHLDKYIAKTHDNIVVYVKDSAAPNNLVGISKTENMLGEYDQEDIKGRYRELGLRNRNQAFNPSTRPNLYFPLYIDRETGYVSIEKIGTYLEEVYPITADGVKTCWTWNREKVQAEGMLLIARRKDDGSWRIFRKDYLEDENGEPASTLCKSLWLDKMFNNDRGRKALKELVGGALIDFPKSPFLIQRIISMGALSENSIVFDLFSGSATTAHAVLEQNALDGGNRRFILVQLPEPCNEKSEAFKAGYSNIAEIGKERIRRVIARIKEENAKDITKQESSQDLGFRVFKLKPSHVRKWQPLPSDATPEDLAGQLEAMQEPLLDGWTVEEVLYEIMLAEGLSLTSGIEEVPCNGQTVYRLFDDEKDQAILVCLDDRIDFEKIKPLGLKPEERFICRDSALDDTTIANLALTCNVKTITEL